ncbi:MAG: hypothetical protein ACYS26_01320 [Planctomycetota bacterium]|jgi:hypothetical protein
MLRCSATSRAFGLAAVAALCSPSVAPAASVQEAPAGAAPSGAIHTTYLWHMHQPIYWPDQRRDGIEDEVEVAWESIQQKNQGAFHPENNLVEIFGKDDRVAAYQWRVKDSVGNLLGYPDAGAQVNYTGALSENIASLGSAFQLGYSPSWNAPIAEANAWTTSGGQSRVPITQFAHHHALLPLHTRRTVDLQIAMHAERMQQVWGPAGVGKGFFPPETAFSERLIPSLVAAGVEWVFVSNEHLSRACPDFPVVFGSGGVMCDPPNRADQINAPGGTFWSKFIDRGCSPTNAVPFAYVPHRAQYVDPETGQVSEIIVVPTAQALSWDDGYGPQGANALDGIAGGNDPARPMLVTLAHDGDNAWGGGFSYYMEAVPNFVASAASYGYRASTVDQYLLDHPVPAGDLVHVEDGAWVNADSDFGAPQFTNWLYPLLAADGSLDPVNGWGDKAREYAIFIAAENRLRTAEDLAGGPSSTRIDHVLDPRVGTTGVERGWHYYLASMDSGNVYYGNALDMEVKGTVGCNEALEHVLPLLSGVNAQNDPTGPSVFPLQRHPYNPGATNFGAPYGYQTFQAPTEFTVWTFADDVTGIAQATLYWREDADGSNPLLDHANELYADGPGVGAWTGVPMQMRPFPSNNVYGWPGLDAYDFESPNAVAQHLSATIDPGADRLLDYYVEVVDAAGNATRTEIRHVWVGDGAGAGPAGGAVSVQPDPAEKGKPFTVRYESAGTPLDGAAQVNLHQGFDGWSTANGLEVLDRPMTAVEPGVWEVTFGVPSSIDVVDFVFNDGGGTWDNNNGSDWHVAAVESTSSGPQVTPLLQSIAVEQGGQADPLGWTLTADEAGLAFQATVIELSGDPRQDLRATRQAVEQLQNGTLSGSAASFEEPQGWLGVATTAGSLSAEEQLALDGLLQTDYLPVGSYAARLILWIDGAGPPLTADVELTVEAPAPPPPPVPTQTGTEPAQPAAGETVRVWYVPASGSPLENASALVLHWGINGWQSGTVQDALLTPLAGAWYVDLQLPGNAAELNFAVNDGNGTWDNNGGGDWNIAVSGASGPPASTTVEPNPPQAGQSARIWYLSSGSPLSNANSVWCHWGLDGWQPATIADGAMSLDSSGVWFLDVLLPPGTTELNFVFNDGNGTWDNNGGSDWLFAVQ